MFLESSRVIAEEQENARSIIAYNKMFTDDLVNIETNRPGNHRRVAVDRLRRSIPMTSNPSRSIRSRRAKTSETFTGSRSACLSTIRIVRLATRYVDAKIRDEYVVTRMEQQDCRKEHVRTSLCTEYCRGVNATNW